LTRSITIEDVGPIKRLAIPAPEEGGVVVLRGGNGVGKTEAIDALGTHLTGEGKLAPRDGSLAGKVEGLGRLTSVGTATRRLGGLAVPELDAQLSPAQLVDPGLKDLGAADRRRIQVACLLAKVKADASLFAPLIGGLDGLKKVASSEALAAPDIVAMAFGLKRDFESAARAQEQRADAEQGASAGLRSAVGDVDMSEAADATALGDALEEAVRKEAAVVAARGADEQKEAAARVAREAFDAAGSHDTISQADAERLLTRSQAALLEARESVGKLTRLLEQAAVAAAEAERTVQHNLELRNTARERDAMLAGWAQAIADGERTSGTTPDDVVQAHAMVDRARQRVERGAVVRRSLIQLEEANRHSEAAATALRESARLRDAAAGCEEVLAGAMQASDSSVLRIKNGRLVTTTARGETYFAELSHGERWLIAMDLTLEALGDDRVMHIPQEAWAALDADARAAVQAHALLRKTVVITAEADYDEVGPLRAEVLA
jgi:hypothetical protein